MALTAKTNKIEDKKKMDKKIDAEYEKITLENLSQYAVIGKLLNR
ncbi:hypothetical protein [Rickettsia amblyommatis]|uniref:Uncharacterized protein n=2 Tax=spotted fever group TaxID=114277 RepID=A0A0F3N079_RICAM|nr:hypothetical protein [Rickettsia amblyommatis]KJV61430.1 hypothetical protein APHACPA_0437 [Rickettsia amblyommatis str. Ac/Pa]KJV97703.1 hypothetical protein RAMDARK_0209 [Rickettsia amblyommatis str. Darkwater]